MPTDLTVPQTIASQIGKQADSMNNHPSHTLEVKLEDLKKVGKRLVLPCTPAVFLADVILCEGVVLKNRYGPVVDSHPPRTKKLLKAVLKC
jgi:hypothetical protein